MRELEKLGVAPHTGAWIETPATDAERSSPKSRPIRARGLKLDWHLRLWTTSVAPHTGAWIETTAFSDTSDTSSMSRPIRARGLKQRKPLYELSADCRAPYGRVD